MLKIHTLPVAFIGLLAATVCAAATTPHGLQPKQLATLDRFSSPTLSPNGRLIVFAKRVVDYEADKASTSLWIENLVARDSAPPVQLTPDGWNVNSPAFAPGGDTVYFLSRHGGSSQLYSIGIDGGEPTQVTDFALDVDGFQLGPNGKRIAFNVAAFVDCGSDLACTKDKLEAREKDPTTGVLYDHLFVRHWDTWNDGRLNRVFVADLPAGDAKPVTSATAIATDVHADVPSKPFGDSSEYVWAPDGKVLMISARLSSPQEPWSTNFDIWKVDAAGKAPSVNLTADNLAWDSHATFSTDGKTLYYTAMKRPGFEADRNGLIALDLASGKRHEIAPEWDRSAGSITVSANGKTLYVTAADMGERPLFAVDIGTGKVNKLIGAGSIGSVSLEGGTLAFTRASFNSGAQVFVGGINGAPERAISPSAGDMLPEVRFGAHEQFHFKGWNGDTVYGYVVKPWNYQDGKKYPVAFLIHGGPQGSFGNGWSYRWNPQTYAGQGYAVVMIDFHGSVGYGQDFTDAISGHWGDRPLEDLKKGWQAAQQQFAFLDGDNACALGASYGGYMINWIAGNWNEPWKCLVSHDGVFDTRMMGFVTEELWFTEWENGGTPWAEGANYDEFNPSLHVADWKVPMLVIQGQQDFRIPLSQGLGVFTALQRQGIESKFLYFPDENHWVLKPHNSVLWHNTVNGWLEKYLGS